MCAHRFHRQLKIQKPRDSIRPTVLYSGSPLYNLSKYITNILKAYFKDENNKAKNFIFFSNWIKNLPIENEEIMVSIDVTCWHLNISIADTLNLIKDYVNDDNQFTRKTAIPQHKFHDLCNVFLTS